MKKYYRNIEEIRIADERSTVIIEAGSLFELVHESLVLVDDDVFAELRFDEEKFRYVGNDIETVDR